MSVYKAASKLQRTAHLGASMTRTTADIAASTSYDVLRFGTREFAGSFSVRPGSYGQNFMEGRIIPLKLKPLVGLGVVGGITGISATQGYMDYNEIDTSNSEVMGVEGVLSNQRSPYKKKIDDMGADGNIVFGLHDRR